jgi:hypothetical protein
MSSGAEPSMLACRNTLDKGRGSRAVTPGERKPQCDHRARQPFTGRAGTGPFFGHFACTRVSTVPENMDLSPTSSPRERLLGQGTISQRDQYPGAQSRRTAKSGDWPVFPLKEVRYAGNRWPKTRACPLLLRLCSSPRAQSSNLVSACPLHNSLARILAIRMSGRRCQERRNVSRVRHARGRRSAVSGFCRMDCSASGRRSTVCSRQALTVSTRPCRETAIVP